MAGEGGRIYPEWGGGGGGDTGERIDREYIWIGSGGSGGSYKPKPGELVGARGGRDGTYELVMGDDGKLFERRVTDTPPPSPD